MALIDAAALLRASEAEAGIVEESGRIVGLLTLEDLLEPLTGMGA